MEWPYHNMVWLHWYITEFSDLNFFLLNDFLEAPPTPNSTTCTDKSDEYTWYCPIQKGCLECIVAAVGINSLLSAISNYRYYLWFEQCYTISLSRCSAHVYFSLPKFNIKSHSLLLEDWISKTSCERHIKEMVLFIIGLYNFFTLRTILVTIRDRCFFDIMASGARCLLGEGRLLEHERSSTF